MTVRNRARNAKKTHILHILLEFTAPLKNHNEKNEINCYASKKVTLCRRRRHRFYLSSSFYCFRHRYCFAGFLCTYCVVLNKCNIFISRMLTINKIYHTVIRIVHKQIEVFIIFAKYLFAKAM